MIRINPKIRVWEWLYKMSPYSNVFCGSTVSVVADHWTVTVFGIYALIQGVVVMLARLAPKEIGW